MRPRRRFESILAILLLMAGCLSTVAAQNSSSDFNAGSWATPSVPGSTDPPSRVARIQYMSGEVSIQPAGINDWIAAELNRPLTTSDRLWTDKNSKAELNVGGGYLRLDSESSLTLTNISNNTVQVRLYQGTLEMTVRYLGAGQIYEVDTPNLAFTAMKPGAYRFNVFPDEDQTWVTVRRGYGEATGRGNAVKVKAGEQVRFRNETSLAHTAEPAPAPDGFDDWAKVRDERLDSSGSARYVAPGVIGYEDLDPYGHWQTIAPFGPVWIPYSVPVGWAPYRFGHWAWIAPWGWTWVDNAPWGFAPFHYGRWVYWGGYWGWAPGPYRWWTPCYAPALVAWVGGPGFGIGFGFAGAGWGIGLNFGWFPLGWGEPYYPWYHGWYGHRLSATYIKNVNVTNTYITNVTNITNNYYNNNIANTHYVNRTVNGAVTAAPASAIANGQRINQAGKPVPSSALMHAPVVRNINATPTREAFLGGQEPRTNAIPEASAFSRSVVTHAPSAYSRPTPARVNAPVPVATPTTPAAAVAPGAPKPAPQPGSTTLHNVPRPPSAAEVPHGPLAATPHTEAAPAPHVTPSAATHPSAPVHEGTPTPHPATGESHPSPQAAAHVPRPPPDYTYHAAAGYGSESRSASGATVIGTAHSNSYAPAVHPYTAGPGYNVHGSYPAATPYVPSSQAYPGFPSHAFQANAGSVPHGSTSSEGARSWSSSEGGYSSGSSHAMHASGGAPRR